MRWEVGTIPVFPSLTLICPSVKWVYGEQGLWKARLVSRQRLRVR